MSPRQRDVLLAVAVTVISLFGCAWWYFGGNPFRSVPTPQHLRLADGVDAYFLSDSRIDVPPSYPHPREIRVDGDFFIRAPEAAAPLIIRSRLLVLTITGKTALRVTAYAKEAGEQAEVLYGHVKAEKNYPSSFTEPDLLTDGQMTMINRDIDLMEKETTDLAKLQAWKNALVRAAAGAEQERGR